MFLFVRKAHQRTIKPSGWVVWHGRESWDNLGGWRETGTRSTQEENWSIADAFSTDLLNLEGVNILYSKGFDIVPFFWEVRENKFF